MDLLKEKLSSRKFIITVAGVITIICNDYYGLGLEKETVLSAIGLMMSYVVGQGYVDGKYQQNKNNK
ncbi:hypothetical protein CIB95_08275 [Lottiidibacillus patelloidae]|uniref:Uncharacterized protein n=1 Tax=Lottiidibacillus patelloidae TaxID=2670334 RepID=A0A263BUL6_9BACI|nr:hypothetical protein [Lottiidibacillus patelloidae]OZM57441.1 hypothetical protein CIB95_08275 [Lottiidibacillus patelloidae]